MFPALLRNSIKCINLRIHTNGASSRNIFTSAFRCKWRSSGSADTERNLLRDDNLAEHYQLIYRAPLQNYVNWAKNVSTATVSIIGLAAGYQLASSMDFVNIAKKIDIAVLISNETDLYYFAVGFVLINLAIRSFVAKYPLRIYKSANKYVAVYSSQMPLGTVKHYFERGQITEYHNVLNPWNHIMFNLGKRSSMLIADYFKTPAEFHQLFVDKQT